MPRGIKAERHAKAFPPTGLSIPLVIAGAALVGCAGASALKPLHADLTESDITLAATTREAALEHARHGETRTWLNPETGHSGAVMPQRTYLSEAGLYCRDYQETLTVHGQSATYLSTACRETEGMWHWID
jgi:surface antigen